MRFEEAKEGLRVRVARRGNAVVVGRLISTQKVRCRVLASGPPQEFDAAPKDLSLLEPLSPSTINIRLTG